MADSQSTVNLKALGLKTEPNELGVDSGSLSEATDIVIRRDNIVEPRRGFALYGEPAGSVSDRVDQIFEYKQTLLRHYNDILQYDTGTTNVDGQNIFNDFCGSYSEVSPGRRIRSIESNGNFYFTTSSGIQKISASSSDQFTNACGYITPSGGIKALDITAYLNVVLGDTTGFLPTDSVVAYRVVWGTNDANGNLVLGTPSARALVYNSLQQMIIRDYMQVLLQLDNVNVPAESNYTDGNYVDTLGVSLTAPATEIQTDLIALVNKLDLEQGNLVTGSQITSASISSLGVCTVTLNSSSVGLQGLLQLNDAIYLDGTWTDLQGVNISGIYTVSGISLTGSNDTFSFFTSGNPGIMTLQSANVQSGWFRALPQPPVPSSPATHDELTALQIYLQLIITELQISRNVLIASNKTATGVTGTFPLLVTAANVTSSTNLQLTVSSNAKDVYLVGNKIHLDGTWTDSAAGALNGYYTVASVPSATQVNITIPTTPTGAVTTAPNSTVQIIERFSDNLKAEFIDNLSITTTANATLVIPIPDEVNSNYFFQIYRSNIITASQTDVLQDLIPDDEMRLVYEAYPTAAELAAMSVTVEDITPQSFFQGGAFLYTNETNGEGILQANEPPPLAYDINMFKNVIFYANTQTKHNLALSLLGVSNIIDDYNDGNNPTFTIASANGFNDYRFIVGTEEVTNITLPAGTNFSNSTSKYFLINGGNNVRQYYVWFMVNGGTNVDPAISGRTGLEVVINSTDSNTVIAQKVADVLNTVVDDFSASIASNVVTVTNYVEGPTDSISPLTATGTMSGVTGYSATVTTEGNGENVANQVTVVNTVAASGFTAPGVGEYFKINTAFDRTNYYVWFNVNATNTNPNVSGLTGVQVDLASGDTAPQVAVKLNDIINGLTGDFTSTVNGNSVTITNVNPGPATNATEFVTNPSFTITTSQVGALNVLLSSNISPSLALQETTQSLVNVINKNTAELVYGFYLSGITDVPGKFLLQEKTLANIPFYVVTNTDLTGKNFNPDLSPEFTITNITTGAMPTITVSSVAGLANKTNIVISGSNSFPSIDGVHEITNITGNTFQIVQNVVIAGNEGAGIRTVDAAVSSNEAKPNRIYYSKYLQPEAVPLVNFLDVGAQDKAILRIIPLRDSLFVLKEDGVYRISGETAPFNIALFDTSYICLAPDSVAIANNIVYGWTSQGIMTLTEGGAQIISRDIDVNILPLASEQYTNFSTATFGVGYNSEYSYMVWTVSKPADVVATQAYVYNNLTATWVQWDMSNTCGLVNPINNKLYLGAGDVNYIEQERKNFDRTDYADREIDLNIELNNYQVENSQLKFFQLANVNNLSAGDVITQEQTISIFDFNSLLQRLDNDPGVNTNYTIDGVSYNSVSRLARFSVTTPMGFFPDMNDFMNIGDKIVVSNVNPIGYNGVFTIQAITANVFTVSIPQNPGAWINNTVGQLNFSYFDSFSPQPGTSLRIALENLANQLTIRYNDGGLTPNYDYSRDIAEYSFQGVSVSATDPAVFTMPAHLVNSIDGTLNTIETTSNSFIDGMLITFHSTDTYPFPIVEDTLYYARNNTSSSFQISDTLSGAVLDLDMFYSGTLSAYKAHGLKTGRFVQINNSTTVPNINNNYEVTEINKHQFSIDVSVDTEGLASYETLINNFKDIQGCYNIIIEDLNLDVYTAFKNYKTIEGTTLFETPVSSINYPLKELQITYTLPFVVGPIKLYKAINSSFEYSPISMSDAMSLKHFREATIIYLNKTFSTASVEFASDLLPELVAVPITGLGAGLYGNNNNGENYYGGNSNSAPFRTYIPLNKARCRFLRVRHTHSVAREKYSILGTSVTGKITSTRGYR